MINPLETGACYGDVYSHLFITHQLLLSNEGDIFFGIFLEADDASELLENSEKMFPRYLKYSEVLSKNCTSIVVVPVVKASTICGFLTKQNIKQNHSRSVSETFKWFSKMNFREKVYNYISILLFDGKHWRS